VSQRTRSGQGIRSWLSQAGLLHHFRSKNAVLLALGEVIRAAGSPRRAPAP